jgi:VWFA-related protein
MRFRALARALCVAGLATVAGHGQEQTPTFKTRTDIVRLNVSVIETRTGKPVTDLAERDFTISENGVRQTISTFAVQSESAERAVDANRRVFLVVLGGGRIEGPVDPYEGAAQFLRQHLRPNEQAAVMAFNRATPFMTDHGALAQVVERVKVRRDEILFELFQLFRMKRYQLDVPESIQASIDEIFQPPDGPPVRLRSATTMILGTPEFQANDRRWRRWNLSVMSGIDLLKVYAGIEYLRHVPGQKHLVLLTNGLTSAVNIIGLPVGLWLNDTEDERRLSIRANDAGIAVHIVNTHGTSGVLQATIMASRNAAELTGGHFTSLRTANDQLARIDAATRTGYVIGYAPQNPALDGKYRNVAVTVNRSGATVVYPHGYTARAEAPPLDVRELTTRERLRDASRTDIAQDDIKVQASATSLADSKGRQVRVELKIDASKLTLTQNGPRYEGMIDLLILCGDSEQRVVGLLNQQMTMSLDAARYQQAMTSGIPYVATIPITAPAAVVKVLVYDYDADLLGAATVRLR